MFFLDSSGWGNVWKYASWILLARSQRHSNTRLKASTARGTCSFLSRNPMYVGTWRLCEAQATSKRDITIPTQYFNRHLLCARVSRFMDCHSWTRSDKICGDNTFWKEDRAPLLRRTPLRSLRDEVYYKDQTPSLPFPRSRQADRLRVIKIQEQLLTS